MALSVTRVDFGVYLSLNDSCSRVLGAWNMVVTRTGHMWEGFFQSVERTSAMERSAFIDRAACQFGEMPIGSNE